MRYQLTNGFQQVQEKSGIIPKELWNIERVKMAVAKKWITEKEYEKITGEKYAA